MFHLEVFIQVKDPKDIDLVIKTFKDMRQELANEKGCVRWEAHQNTDKPEVIILVETWQTKADWEEHLKNPIFKKYYYDTILPRITREAHPTHRFI